MGRLGGWRLRESPPDICDFPSEEEGGALAQWEVGAGRGCEEGWRVGKSRHIRF